MSPNAQNEIPNHAFKSAAWYTSDIAESGYYCIMADESIDVSNFELLVICIRWTERIWQYARNILVWCQSLRQMHIQLSFASKMWCCLWISEFNARWQCYYSCSTMTGTKNVFAAQIKKLDEKCLVMLCYCYSHNLAVGDLKKKIPLLKDWNVISIIWYGLTNSENP